MVDFLYNSTGEDVEDDKKNQPFSDPLSLLSVPDFDEFSLSFADSLLDFDSLSDLISDSPMADRNQEPTELGSVEVEFRSNDGVSEKSEMQTEDPLSCLNQEERQIGVSEKCEIQTEDPLSCLNQEERQIGVSEKCEIQTEDPLSCLNQEKSQIGVSEKCEIQTVDPLSCLNQEQSHIGDTEVGLKVEDLDCIVEEKMGRVSISGNEDERVVDQVDVGNVSGSVVAAVICKNEESDNKVVISSKAEETIVHDTGVNGSAVNKSDTESESESESSSSAASSSDSDEDESSSNDESEGKGDMEEGEIVASDPDEMVGWDEDDDTGVKGPIRSKNEVQVLPPVPEVTATLQPHHQMQPVGVVSSIIGAQVVVEGVEKHTPLCDGSILWITESRSPLGIVDEIFGPVKNPYYIVRYNSDHEVPPGIHPGTLISFIPEFSSHILNDNSLYKKGYDASGENDEEASEDDFSDDEKEAEYRRMLKMKKRGITNDQKPGNKKKDKRNLKNQSQNWKHDQGAAATDVQRENGKPSVDQNQRVIPAAATPLDQGIHQSASRQGHGQSIRPPSVPPFPHMQNSPGLAALSTGVWPNGIPYQQPQNMGFPNTMPNIGMSWPQQGHPQQMFQMPLPNALPFEQQISPTLPSSFMFPGGLPNFGAGGPSFGPWPPFGQNVFGQSPMAMGLPGQFTPAPMNMGGQVPANGPQSGQNNNSQPNAGYINGSPNFNQGQSPLPMGVPGQFTPTPMNLGGQVPENGPNSGQNNTNVSPNFNRGAHSGGGRRGNHRGGGRFGGRRGRGRSQRN